MRGLVGYLRGDNSTRRLSRSDADGVTAQLETWDSSIQVTLDADGDAIVRIGKKGIPTTIVWAGNIDQLTKAMP